MDLGEFTEDEARAVAVKVREALALRRMSRAGLADAAGIGLSTLEKALSGQRPFTLATLVRLESVLKTPLRAAAAADAPADLGGYGRASVDWLAGDYLTLRPSFERKGVVYAYLTKIHWDEARSRLVFQEGERLDDAFTQKGVVSLPHQSGQVYLVTNDHGQHRLITLGRPTITGDMHGMLSTLQADRGGRLIPACAPIVLTRLRDMSSQTFGQIDEAHPSFEAYRARLTRAIDEDFARIITL